LKEHGLPSLGEISRGKYRLRRFSPVINKPSVISTGAEEPERKNIVQTIEKTEEM